MFTLNCKGKLLVINKPIVMGIINATPDSFYGDSRITTSDEVLRFAEKMINDGATILDIGGQSTRPGSNEIGAAEELDRVLPVIEKVATAFPETFISIDTYHASVAKAAVDSGASIVNDVSGGSLDMAMLETVANLNVPYICMHMKGTPATMQQFAEYKNVTLEVLDYFIQKVNDCKLAGINDVIIDPGFGFAKTISQNLELLNNLEALKILERPLLAGLSRKATIYKTLHSSAENALNGTTVLNTIALMKGATILRVHDVEEAAEAIKLVEAMNTATYESQK